LLRLIQSKPSRFEFAELVDDHLLLLPLDPAPGFLGVLVMELFHLGHLFLATLR